MNPMKTRKAAKVLAILIVVAMLLTSFSYLTVLWGAAPSGAVYGAETKNSIITDPNEEGYAQSQLEFLQKVISYIASNYKDEVSADDLIHGAYAGVFEALKDPYSIYYVTEEQGTQFTQNVSGEFYGIGVKLSDDPKGCLITDVVPDTPADEAGLRAGDIITAVNGMSLAGISSKEGVGYIRGEKGSEATFTIDRSGVILTMIIVRDTVRTQSVSEKLLDGNIGYIRIGSFDSDGFIEFALAKSKLLEEGATSFIVDLRDNGGGIIGTAVNIANQLMPKGPILHYESKGELIGSEEATGEGELGMPMIVLVNGGTASASEILAGALQDSKVAKLVGTTTYGKGVAQQVMNMKNGGSMKLSIFYFLTPDKHKIDHVGITPDYIVYNGDEAKGEDVLTKYQGFAPMTEQTKAGAGETGLNVYGAQQRLNMLGYDVSISATMDAATVSAVKKFQQEHDLYAYGGLDNATVRAIDTAATEYVYAHVYGDEDKQLAKAVELLTQTKK